MTIALPNFDRNHRITPKEYADRLIDIISVGRETIKAVEKSRYFRERRISDTYADIIRQCHRTLGAAGNFKTGCLYREDKLEGAPRGTTCDHSIPITILRDWVSSGRTSFEVVAFAPVALLTHESDKRMNKLYSKTGHNLCYESIMERYKQTGIKLITHDGYELSDKWGWDQHIDLVLRTEPLKDIVSEVLMLSTQSLAEHEFLSLSIASCMRREDSGPSSNA